MSTLNTRASKGTRTTPPPSPVSAPRNPAMNDPSPTRSVNSRLLIPPPHRTVCHSGRQRQRLEKVCGGGTGYQFEAGTWRFSSSSAQYLRQNGSGSTGREPQPARGLLPHGGRIRFSRIRTSAPRAGPPGTNGARAVRAADAGVAAVVERIVRDVVGEQVVPDVLVAPGSDGVDLDQLKFAVPLDLAGVSARRSLVTPDGGDPCAQRGELVFQGLNFADLAAPVRIDGPQLRAEKLGLLLGIES